MHILIVGAGDIGFQLAKRLAHEKHDITMIEADPQAPTTIEWAELDETRQLLAQFDGRPITNEQKEVNT